MSMLMIRTSAICMGWRQASALAIPLSSYLPWRAAVRSQVMRYSSILDTIGNTPLVELKSFSPRPGVQIFAKLEGANPSGSIKDRIARKMIEEAEASGKLTKDSILLEPTSGNTGIALAMIARVKGYPFTAGMPGKVTQKSRHMVGNYWGKNIFSYWIHGSKRGGEVRKEI